jgi:very-short-patch-repair endonuclease
VKQLLIDLAAAAQNNDGVTSRADAVASGVTRSQLHRWIAGGLVIANGPRALTFPGTPETYRHQVQRALINAGPTAAASHRTAAHLLGFEGFGEAPVEIVVPRKRKDTAFGEVIVHSSATLRPADTTEVAGFRCTAAARTIVDLAAVCSTSELEKAIDSAVRLGHISVTHLTNRLTALRHPGREGVRLLDGLLIDSGGTNHLERRFLELCRLSGLPKPMCQVQMKRGTQTVARVDFNFAPRPVVVEVEGQIGHASPTQRNRDAKRRRELAAIGIEVVSFTYDDVIKDGSGTTQYLKSVFARALQSVPVADNAI